MPEGRRDRLWRWLVAPPDEFFADAARDGEMLVARVRTWLLLLLTLGPVIGLALGPGSPRLYASLVMAMAGTALAVTMEHSLQTFYHPTIGFASAIADVTLVSIALVVAVVIELPLAVSNSRIVFECYFLAIGASALRYDPRVTVAAGAAAMVEYLLLTLMIANWPLGDALLPGMDYYGGFDWGTQLARVALLLAMTVVALAIVHRTQRFRELSTADRLTGLFNRAYAEEYLTGELLRTERSKSSLVVAMLDVDHFKHFNDTWGHPAGDVALQRISDAVRRSLRRTDVVARYGGEEMLIILPATTMESALEKLDAVRVQVGLSDIPIPRGGSTRVTVSIGVAAWGTDGRNIAELLDVADARLYQAKAGGRNRVIGPSLQQLDMMDALVREEGMENRESR